MTIDTARIRGLQGGAVNGHTVIGLCDEIDRLRSLLEQQPRAVPDALLTAQAEPTAKVRIEAHFDDCVRTSYHDVQIAQAAGGVGLDERQEFDRWLSENSRYAHCHNSAWQAWQARALLAQQQPEVNP